MDIKLNTNHLDVDLKQNHVNITMQTHCSGGTGTTDHSKLTNLDYEHSGHTGFASAAQIQELLDLLNNKQDTLIAGDNISIVDNIISATGLTKDEIYIGPDEPTDPNIKIWIDTNEVAEEFYTKKEIDAKNFATETWVSAQGYLTEHQDLSEYAKKTDIPSLDGYATEQWVEDKGYLTEHQDISGLATKEEVEAVEGKIPDVSGLATKKEIPTEYVKSATVQGNKLTLTNKDNTTVDFEPSGGSGSGANADEETIITNAEGKLETAIGGKWVDGLVDGPVIVDINTTSTDVSSILTYDIMQELISKGDNLRANINTGYGDIKAKKVIIDTSKENTYVLKINIIEYSTAYGVYTGQGDSSNWSCKRDFENAGASWNKDDNLFYAIETGKKPSPIKSADFIPYDENEFFTENGQLKSNSLKRSSKGGYLLGSTINLTKKIGNGTLASTAGSCDASFSIMWGSQVSNNSSPYSILVGDQNYGYSGSRSAVFGFANGIRGDKQFATGQFNNWLAYSSAENICCMGEGLGGIGKDSLAQGKYNISELSGSSMGTYAHIVGNGTSDSTRSNAYTLDWQGNGTFAGTVSSSTGADYAEYFEWKDGNPNNEDRVGYIVTLDGDKIVKANTGDDVLGICSGTAMVLGDSAEWNWTKRYLTDDFGRIIYEDRMEHHEAIYNPDGELIEEAWDEEVHAPKENPDYNASRAYIKRSERPEWQIVGMMGKLYVRDDGSCVVNGYADVKDGIATKASGKTNMRVMERVTDNIVRVLMK